MASTISTMSLLNPKCLSTNSPKTPNHPPRPIFLLPLQALPKGLTSSKPPQISTLTPSLTGTALAGAIFSALSSSDHPALAAEQIAQLAEGGDNRGLALLLPIIPAIAWVLFNILQPALNQINKMRSKGVIIGIGGLAASSFMSSTMVPHALAASEIAMIGEVTSDNRGQLLLFVIAPAILWVLYNILQPALNQLNKMRSQ